jgi:hypothetical protein
MTTTPAGRPRQFGELPRVAGQAPDASGGSRSSRARESRRRSRQSRRQTLVLIAVAASGSLAVGGIAVAGQTLLGSSGKNAGPPMRAVQLAPSPKLLATGSPSPSASAMPTVRATRSKVPRQHTMRAVPMGTVATATAQASAVVSASASASPTPSGSPQAVSVTVKYSVITQATGSFEAEVDVTDTGSAPVFGWQIVVTLPQDTFTSFSSNVSGDVSGHILLLTPAPGAAPLAAGGTLHAFFTASGFEQTPTLCAFNNVACG